MLNTISLNVETSSPNSVHNVVSNMSNGTTVVNSKASTASNTNSPSNSTSSNNNLTSCSSTVSTNKKKKTRNFDFDFKVVFFLIYLKLSNF